MPGRGPPRAHGLQSKTFNQPPLDESLSLPALYDWQATHSAEHPLFVFEQEPGSFRTIKWKEGVQAMHRATRYVRKTIKLDSHAQSGKTPPVVAILASTDTVTYFSFIVGALRTGWSIFPISTRNSPPAIANLLQKTGAKHLFVSGETALQELSDASLKGLPDDHVVEKIPMPVFGDLYTDGFDPAFENEPLAELVMGNPALILHSSGSTAFPKPIYWTHQALVWFSAYPCYGEADMAGCLTGCQSIPMAHGMGGVVIAFTLSTGMTVVTFKPQAPAVVPNPVNVIEGCISAKCEYVYCPPTFLEMWSTIPRYVDYLSKMKGAIFGGGPLDKGSGDFLASKGVNIFITYASTQAALSSVFLPKPPGMEWEYFKLSPNREAHFIDYGRNEFEIVPLASDEFRPNVINTKIGNRDAYASSDLVSPHPTRPGYWKVVGRTDDQIMHSTGEKTNPGPLENMLGRDPHVQAAVIFGRSRFHCGVIVQPKAEYIFDPSDTTKLANYRNTIWPTVEMVNAYAPTHSRIFKEMILVTSPAKPFTYTVKASPRRQAIIDEYSEEISALYAAADESAQEDIPGPTDWNLPSITDFVRTVIEQTMKHGKHLLTPDDDIFDHGCDSLQATFIRNCILRVLRENHPLVSKELPIDIIYQNPTISSLSKSLYSRVQGATLNGTQDLETRREELQVLVDKYSSSFPTSAYPAVSNGSQQRPVVLLTGSTGSFGANILAQLITSSYVDGIFALSRPSVDGTSIKERHASAFRREGLDERLLANSRVKFVEGDSNKDKLGLDDGEFSVLHKSITHIIHNAWRVDFNLSVASFEANISGVRNLIDLALTCPGGKSAKFGFVSSIAVFQSLASNKPAKEEPLTVPDSAIGSGYGEAKWVAEQIVLKASENTALRTVIVRPGQLTGGPSGFWNEHEWFPSLIKSSIALRCLPDARGTVSWIPSDIAAIALLDLMQCDEPIVHLVHPKPVSWSAIISEFSKDLNLPTVPYHKWLASLEQSHARMEVSRDTKEALDAEMRAKPALQLLDFFKKARDAARDENREPLGIVRLSSSKAMEASPILHKGEFPQIGEANVRRWISGWKLSLLRP